jgi:hypothetical protein
MQEVQILLRADLSFEPDVRVRQTIPLFAGKNPGFPLVSSCLSADVSWSERILRRSY